MSTRLRSLVQHGQLYLTLLNSQDNSEFELFTTNDLCRSLSVTGSHAGENLTSLTDVTSCRRAAATIYPRPSSLRGRRSA